MAGSWSLLSNGVTSTFSCHVGWILEIIECPHRVFYFVVTGPQLAVPNVCGVPALPRPHIRKRSRLHANCRQQRAVVRRSAHFPDCSCFGDDSLSLPDVSLHNQLSANSSPTLCSVTHEAGDCTIVASTFTLRAHH